MYYVVILSLQIIIFIRLFKGMSTWIFKTLIVFALIKIMLNVINVINDD